MEELKISEAPLLSQKLHLQLAVSKINQFDLSLNYLLVGKLSKIWKKIKMLIVWLQYDARLFSSKPIWVISDAARKCNFG